MGYTATAETGQEISWKDGKRYVWILSGILPVIPLLGWIGYSFAPHAAWWYGGPILVFGLIPILDVVIGKDANNPPDEIIEALENDKYYRYVTYLYIPTQLAMFFGGMFLIGGGTILGWDPFAGEKLVWGIPHELSFWEQFGLTLTLGHIAGIGINTAHELGHKKEELERWFARIALGQTAYGHFYIEHNRGHHVRVATPPDPASSRLGETFLEFLPRTVWGSLTSAWELESKRFERLGKSKYSFKNDLINAWMFTWVFWGAVLIGFGDTWTEKGILAGSLVVQAAIGIWLLESVNYLEHYGMLRKKLESGRYERVSPAHSWNSNNIVTNIFLYHLQRHSDHHANPTRRYQALREFPEAPVLPTGYAGSIIMANVTPWWRSVMDKKVVGHVGGDLSRINMHPRTRDKYIKKFNLTDKTEETAAV